MSFNPFQQIAQSSDAMLCEQFASLRSQIPLMYALMLMNAMFLAFATYGEVSPLYSLGMPLILMIGTAVRAGIWLARRAHRPQPSEIKRHLYGTIVAAAVLSMAFGAWGVMLLHEAPATRGAAIALYVFVGSISCCYCLQALPVAGRLVLLFGALPITLRLLLSGDWYLSGIAASFSIVSIVILQTLSAAHATTAAAIATRSEMSDLIAALRRSEEHHRYSVDLNPQIPWISDAAGMVTELSPRWNALTGLATADSLGIGWAGAVHQDDVARVQGQWAKAVATGRSDLADARFRVRIADGSYRCVRSRAWPRLDADGNVASWYGNLEDIDDQIRAERALQQSEERYRLASKATTDVIWDILLDEDRIVWNAAAATMLGYDDVLAGTTRQWLRDRLHPDDRAGIGKALTEIANKEFTHWTQEFRLKAASGEYLNIRSRGYVVRDAAGKATRIIGSMQDITAQKGYENSLRFAAHNDSLTQLPNRLSFAQALDAALANGRECGTRVGLIVLDVDGFKTINDSLGHDTGDALLREIAARLRSAAPDSATVARLGGDEFAIILPQLGDKAAGLETAERLLANVSSPMMYAGHQIEVRLSAGIAAAMEDGENAEELRKSADLALYAAKRDCPGGARAFERELRRAAERQKQMLSDARSALHEDWIVPFYQPKVCLRTGAILGFEALLRLHHPQRGLLSPAAISAAFEDPGTAVQITDRMLDRVICDMLRWQDRGLAFGQIAINGSPEDFRRGDFADRILDRFHRAQLPPSALELEVTETVFLGQLAAKVSASLHTLSAAGVTIALDDFGTGYASLTHLKQFPVDTLKIDRSFVSRLSTTEHEDAAIVGAVIELAKSLGIATVAEGIETSAQAAHLVVKGCDAGQGYLFSRPIAAEQVGRTILGWSDEAALSLCGSNDWGDEARRLHFGKPR